ncbi:Cro/Cl family transcriptional regulator [Acinetobacter baumannii]|nr:Cro/CI family transcriptional regulator [Acinetobacter baumannii]
MNVNDLKKHYKCKTKRELHKKMGYSEVTLWKWEKWGIPPRTQSHLQVLTDGKLKADKTVLVA